MIAVALSPKARALIQEHRNAPLPTAADRERVAAVLRARLGAAVLPLDTLIPRRILTAGQRLSATAFGVCVVGSVLLLARRPVTAEGLTTQMGNKPAVAALAAPATAEASEPATVSERPAPSVPAVFSERAAQPQRKLAINAARPPLADVRAPTASDPLAEEVLLLSSATSQLNAGQAGRALLVVEEHQRRFPSGALSDERNAAKARALCMLHRVSEGRAAIARLKPGTPLTARVKHDCDLASAR